MLRHAQPVRAACHPSRDMTQGDRNRAPVPLPLGRGLDFGRDQRQIFSEPARVRCVELSAYFKPICSAYLVQLIVSNIPRLAILHDVEQRPNQRNSLPPLKLDRFPIPHPLVSCVLAPNSKLDAGPLELVNANLATTSLHGDDVRSLTFTVLVVFSPEIGHVAMAAKLLAVVMGEPRRAWVPPLESRSGNKVRRYGKTTSAGLPYLPYPL